MDLEENICQSSEGFYASGFHQLVHLKLQMETVGKKLLPETVYTDDRKKDKETKE